ncbi:MAG: nucleoside monophosphate kinase [Candidatus Paceibacterota bacterium]|jgi:adenylate kinase family enzyme
MEFPVFKTKAEGKAKKFNLNDPKERGAYFNYKAGTEIKKLSKYFDGGNSFVAYLVGKKSSGKGTYSKMFAEVIAPDKIEHFSVGDMIRGVDLELKDPKKKKELVSFLEKNYRGWHEVSDLVKLLEARSTKVLLPTELILTLVKREIEKRPKKTIFIDGFPRDLDQINFSLFFRDLINYRRDPDLFILISVPRNVIDERIKFRRICPKCQTSRNLTLLPTSKVGYREGKKEFFLLCDNPACSAVEMMPKEGDDKGIAPIEERLKKDDMLLGEAAKLHGIPKIFLRNAIPKNKAKSLVDDYEITPGYSYKWDAKKKKVEIQEKPWVVKDDEGKDSYSLMPPPVVVSMIKQMVKVLGL